MNTPVPHAQSIRIYASGRQFVVVPLVPGPDGLPVEVAPIHPVYLTMGRPVAYSLTQAIRDAQARSRGNASLGAEGRDVAWDGEGGKWWAHHLLRVTITWEPGGVAITSAPRLKANAGAPAEDEVAEDFVLPADTPASDIAEWLIRHLGERLHGA